MLGLTDVGILLAYLLCILSAVLCVVYGIINWNKGLDSEEKVDTDWEKEEVKIEEEVG